MISTVDYMAIRVCVCVCVREREGERGGGGSQFLHNPDLYSHRLA